jgi:cytochrome d ubiquinol oxidase subunit II
LQLRTQQDIADRAGLWAEYLGYATAGLFALAGIWVWLGIDGYQIVSMPATDALPNPLAKEVSHSGVSWLSTYGEHPWMWLAPLLGIGGALLTSWLAKNNRPGFGFTTSGLSLTGIILTAGFALFPFVMPSSLDPNSSLTLWDAPSSHLTLTVMFWAAMIFVPIIIAYTTWTYAKMWGRVTVEQVKADPLSY